MFNFSNLTLRNKLIISVILPIFFLFSIFIYLNFTDNLDKAKSNAIYETQLLMDQYSESIYNYFEIKKQMVYTLAQDQSLIDFLKTDERRIEWRNNSATFKHVKKTLNNLNNSNDELTAVFVMVDKTKDYFDSGSYVSQDDYDISTRYWYQELIKNDDVYLQNINFDDIEYRKFLMSIRYPMYLDGQFLGGVGLDFSINALNAQIDKIKLDKENQQLLVINEGGQILKHPKSIGITDDDRSATASRDEMNELIPDISKLESLDLDKSGKFSHVKDAVFHIVNPVIAELRTSENTSEDSEIRIEEVDFEGEHYYVFLKKVKNINWIVSISVNEDALFEEAYSKSYIDIIYMLILLALGVLVIFGINRTITKPLDEMLSSLKSFISGRADLTKRLNFVRTDEIGRFASYFDDFVAKQQKLLSLIHDNSKLVVEDAVSIGQTATSTSESFNDLLEKANNTVSATSELSVSIKEVVSNAENSVVNINKSNDVVLKSVKDINNVLLRVTDMTNELKNISSDVNDLKNDYREVKKISYEIGDIADRISILSLNAQIEAIRAGESGSGFNVVADEMAQLSDSTKNSINFVNQITDRVEEQIVKIVDQMADVSEMITVFQSNVNESLEKLNTIQVNSENTTNLIEQIAVTAKQQSTVSNEINEYIAELMDTMTSIGNDIYQSKDKTDAMKTSSDVLLENVSNFKL